MSQQIHEPPPATGTSGSGEQVTEVLGQATNGGGPPSNLREQATEAGGQATALREQAIDARGGQARGFREHVIDARGHLPAVLGTAASSARGTAPPPAVAEDAALPAVPATAPRPSLQAPGRSATLRPRHAVALAPRHAVALAAVAVAVLALVLAVFGRTAGSPEMVSFGERSSAVPAAEEVSATLLSGYAGKSRTAAPGEQEVLAASVQLTNPTDENQRYFVTVAFVGADGRTLLMRDFTADLPPQRLIARQLFTATERPDEPVSLRIEASRTEYRVLPS